MNTRPVLAFHLALMGGLVAFAVLAPARFVALLGSRPDLYLHAKFVHVFSVTLFFANVVLGTAWETRSLASGSARVARFTYETVALLDAFLTAPLVLLALLSGLTLGTLIGGVFSAGWLVAALALFVVSGVVWVAADIPTQYRVKRLFAELPREAEVLPPELCGLLRFRLLLNLASIPPLLVVFLLMVHKPDLPPLDRLLPEPRRAAPASVP